MVKVNVRFLGSLISLTGKDTLTLDLNVQHTIFDCIQLLSKMYGEKFERTTMYYGSNVPKKRVLILKNNVEIGVLEGLDTKLNDGDTIVLVPISHGG